MNRKTFFHLVCLGAAIGLIGYLLFLQVSTRNETAEVPSGTPPGNGQAVDYALKIPEGYHISYFSQNTPGARDLEVSPGGTLLVSLTGQGKVMALPDKNSDGTAEEKTILSGLTRAHGLAFAQVQDKHYLYVAEEDKVVRYLWDEAKLEAKLDRKLLDLPTGGNHYTRSLLFTPDGKLLISLGSTCNVCNEAHPWRAAIVVTDAEGNSPQVYAKGLRNSPFMTLNPVTGQVWATEMGRDLLGDNVPADEINIVKEGPFDYGWPYCYEDQVNDDSFDPTKSRSCSQTITPAFKIPAHSAPLGLQFIPTNSQLFPNWRGDLLVAYHGSWNRSVPTGYKVVHLKVAGDKVGSQEDFLTGFFSGENALGRPVDVLIKGDILYISDDKRGAVYQVTD